MLAFLRPSKLRDTATRLSRPIGNMIIGLGVGPNTVTTLGFLVTCASGLSFFLGWLQLGGALVLLGGAFDILDGYVARTTGKATVFGSFYDSTLDRISEVVVALGVFSLYIGPVPRLGPSAMVYVVALAMAGSLLVSYTRARAEGLGLDCRVGLMQRAERVIFLGGAALLFGSWRGGLVMSLVMLVMALLTNLTALYRIHWVWMHTRDLPTAAPGAAAEPQTSR
jgi:CDP-diacylglycerol---glycerol-3-phosphate 3-phosphatidyltransferase